MGRRIELAEDASARAQISSPQIAASVVVHGHVILFDLPVLRVPRLQLHQQHTQRKHRSRSLTALHIRCIHLEVEDNYYFVLFLKGEYIIPSASV